MYDYAEREITTPAPDPLVVGTRTTYGVASPEVIVTIERRPCADAMSGLPFPDSVVVTLVDRELRGCGQRLSGDQ